LSDPRRELPDAITFDKWPAAVLFGVAEMSVSKCTATGMILLHQGKLPYRREISMSEEDARRLIIAVEQALSSELKGREIR
jgi:hypothetical protein